jgi:hypothetical protein
MDEKQRQKITRIALKFATAAVIAQELLFAIFLWLAGFDFFTRRPALGLAAGFAVVVAIFVFGFTYVWLVKLLLLEATERQQSRNP